MIKKFIASLFALALLSSQVLASGFLIDPYKFAAAGVAPSLSFCSTTDDTANLTNYSLASVNICSEATDRLIIAYVGTTGTGASDDVSAVTVNGVSLTERTATSDSLTSGIWTGVVSTGTSVTVDVTVTGGAGAIRVVIWAATGLASSTPVSSNQTEVNAASASISVASNNGDLLVMGCSHQSTSTTFAYETETINERIDSILETASRIVAGADTTIVSGSTNNATCTPAASVITKFHYTLLR